MSNEKREETNKEKQKRLALQKRFGSRITIARQGREAFLAKDYIIASKKYKEYLGILADTKEVEDMFLLNPNMFNVKTEITELLLISHIFWELARIHEMTPKLTKTFQLALNQFVKFTINQPYQVLNSEMLRKYIKKNKGKSLQIGMLNQALAQIHVQSSKCFIATECFGVTHPTTNQLREFKSHLILWPLGESVIELYYRYSSRIIEYKNQKNIYAIIFLKLVKLPLRLFARLTQTSIFIKCSSYLK